MLFLSYVDLEMFMMGNGTTIIVMVKDLCSGILKMKYLLETGNLAYNMAMENISG